MKFDKTLMATAILWSKESYCKRRQVGCVIAHGSEIVSQGFNGTVSGSTNICEEFTKFDFYPEENDEVINCSECEGTGMKWVGNELNTLQVPCSECNGFGLLKYIDKTNPATLHAESNALMSALRRGISTKDCTLYVTLAPCLDCSKLIIQSGISQVLYRESYGNAGIQFLKKSGITVKQLN